MKHITGLVSMLIDDIINDVIGDVNPEVPIKDIAAGSPWVGVLTNFLGIANTVRSTCIDISSLPLTISDALNYAKSDDFNYSAMGIATINSIRKPSGKRINAFDILHEVGKNKRIVMVGKFPEHYIKDLKCLARDVHILETNPDKIDVRMGIYPETAADSLIPKADVLILTGSTLINHSTEKYISLTDSKTYVAIIGPSTPLNRILFEYNVDMLAGVEVTVPEKIMDVIRSGAKKIHGAHDIQYRVMEI